MENLPLKRKLLILDCNGLLWSSQRAKYVPQIRNNHGVYYIRGNIYFERLGLHRFLSRCFQIFDVAIWTCASPARMELMVKTIFTEDEQYRFKFIWDQSCTIDSSILKLDGSCHVMFKDLNRVWQRYSDIYDDSNTILIDDSPMKTFLNPSETALHPPSLKFGDCTDTFLPNILWPFLEKLSCARDVRWFLAINMPKWSLKNWHFDRKDNVEIYERLKKNGLWSCDQNHQSLYTQSLM